MWACQKMKDKPSHLKTHNITKKHMNMEKPSGLGLPEKMSSDLSSMQDRTREEALKMQAPRQEYGNMNVPEPLMKPKSDVSSMPGQVERATTPPGNNHDAEKLNDENMTWSSVEKEYREKHPMRPSQEPSAPK